MMVEALLMLKGDDAPAVGRDRIRLLEAVSRAGSITGGARAVGLTYKAAWDGLDAMARLFGRPVIETRVGGRTGGGARLTPTGTRLVAAFAHLEADLARAARRLDGVIAGTREATDGGRPVLRTSARNVFSGTVAAIQHDALTATVTVALPEGDRIVARVTDESLRDLALAEGSAVMALVKASFVDLAPRDCDAPVLPNRFEATVRRCRVAGADAEVLLDIGHGRTLAATSTAAHVRALDLSPGRSVLARFGAAQVILATVQTLELS